MSTAKLWLTIFLAGFAVIVALLIVTLATPAPYGDLSRIGLVSENEFGWQGEQPSVDPRYLRGYALDAADIVVVGDSFSMTYRWQSVLEEAGYRVTTIAWGQLDETLCADLDAWLDRAGFRGRLVLIESVERLLPTRLDHSQTCTTTLPQFKSKSTPPASYPQRAPGFKLNWNAKLTTGYLTYRNTRKAKASTHDLLVAGRAWVRNVDRGCELFSHRLCNKALFYPNDDKSELAAADVERMRALTARSSRTIVWMIVPDKTTVYVKPDHSGDFAAAFARSGLGPELFEFSKAQKTLMRDFYLPNDTHLSYRGQLAVGRQVLEFVRERLPVPADRPPLPPDANDTRDANPEADDAEGTSNSD